MPASSFWTAKPRKSLQTRHRQAKAAEKKAGKTRNPSKSPSPEPSTSGSNAVPVEVINTDAIESKAEDGGTAESAAIPEQAELREDYEDLLEGYKCLMTEYINNAQRNLAMYKVLQKMKPSLEILLDMRKVAEVAVDISEEKIEKCQKERDEWKQKYEDLLKERLEGIPAIGASTRTKKRRRV